MVSEKIASLLNSLEDDNYPLLGPNIKGLRVLDLSFQSRSKFRFACCSVMISLLFLFVIAQYIELYIMMKQDYTKGLLDVSFTVLNTVIATKTAVYNLWQPYWRQLFDQISAEEKSQIQTQDVLAIKQMKVYIRYSRIITYSYWMLNFGTLLIFLSSPLLKYVSMPIYREKIRNGTEPFPLVLSSWFPFDKTKMPGYSVAMLFQAILIAQGAYTIAVFDTTAVAIMAFLKGQMIILKENCKRIFGEDEELSDTNVLDRIKACHRHHKFLMKQYKLFNSLLSPVMFLYVLVCSISICCSVVQIALGQSSASEKLYVLEYTAALGSQLFLYCWHSNEIGYESVNLDRGVYGSQWWKADVRTRRLLVLLSGQLSPSIILHAGPFTTLSLIKFINIIKGTYSFYTLFEKMQE